MRSPSRSPPRVAFSRDGVESRSKLQPTLWRAIRSLGVVRAWEACGAEGGPVPVGAVAGSSEREADRFAAGFYLTSPHDLRAADTALLASRCCRGAGVQVLRDALRAVFAWHFLAEPEARGLRQCLTRLTLLADELAALPRRALLNLLRHPLSTCAGALEAPGAEDLEEKTRLALRAAHPEACAAAALEAASVGRGELLRAVAAVSARDMRAPSEVVRSALRVLLGGSPVEGVLPEPVPRPCSHCGLLAADTACSPRKRRLQQAWPLRGAGRSAAFALEEARRERPRERLRLEYLCSVCAGRALSS